MRPISKILHVGAIVGALAVAQPAWSNRPQVDVYGPWESYCVGFPQDGVPLRCKIRYATNENEIQWGVNVGTDGAEVGVDGLNRYNCRPLETREQVMLEYDAWTNYPNPDIKSDAIRVLEVMQLHRNFFGDCYNARGRSEAISPSILKAATPDFVKAYMAAERRVRDAVKRSLKSSVIEK